MLRISANSIKQFYVTFYKIVIETVPLPLFINQLLEKMDKGNVNYFRVAARRTNRSRDAIFVFERQCEEFIFKSVK